jgi:hypothetical protein
VPIASNINTVQRNFIPEDSAFSVPESASICTATQPGSNPSSRRFPVPLFLSNKSLTLARRNFNLKIIMAENNPSLPGGALPPKPPEASKVQPKKETVRINLPPKPSAAPTIKLPTLPPGGPSAPIAMPSHAAAAPAAAPRTAAAAPAAAPRPTATAPRPTTRPVAAAPAISGFDKGLAIAAAVMALAALGTTLYCLTLFKPA